MIHRLVDLQPKEEVIGVVRRSLLPELYRFTFALLWVMVPFFFFFPLLATGLFGVFFFLLVELLGMLYLFRQWQVWRAMQFIITTQRVIDIDQTGFLTRAVTSLTFTEIKRVSLHKEGWLSRLFGLRTIRVHSNNAQLFDLELAGVRHAKRVKDLILEVKSLQEATSDSPSAS